MLKGNFTQIPNHILRGGHGLHTLVLGVILSHGVCWASASTLAKEAGVSTRTVWRSIKYWVKNGEKNGVFLRITSGKHSGCTSVIGIELNDIIALPTDEGVPQRHRGMPDRHRGCATGADKENPEKNTPIKIKELFFGEKEQSPKGDYHSPQMGTELREVEEDKEKYNYLGHFTFNEWED